MMAAANSEYLTPSIDYADVRFNFVSDGKEMSIALHQFLDFLVYNAYNRRKMMRNDDLSVFYVSPGEYFAFIGRKRPSSKDYTIFNASFVKLKHSDFNFCKDKNNHLLMASCSILISYVISKSKTDYRKVIYAYNLNPLVFQFYSWQNRNIVQYLGISGLVGRKYSYLLYVYLLRRGIELRKSLDIDYDTLGRNLKRLDNEENKQFNRNLKSAVDEINKLAENSKIKFNIKVKIDNRRRIATFTLLKNAKSNDKSVRVVNKSLNSADVKMSTYKTKNASDYIPWSFGDDDIYNKIYPEG